jgi:predicted DNA-binding protein (MmcQ/YjbR family)
MIGPDDVRRLALSLPEAHEAPHFDSTSFRVRKKIFATMDPSSSESSLVLKLDPEDQHNLAEGRPDVVAPIDGYWGRNGWTRVSVGDLDEGELAVFLRMAWANVAPKRLAQTLARDVHNAG